VQRHNDPLLQDGDRLNRIEFHTRYESMPYLKKAELIEGVVHTEPRVGYRHGQASAAANFWLGYYRVKTPQVMACAHPTLMVDDANEFQPDALLRLEQNGGSWVTDEDYLAGAPELIFEVAEDTKGYEFNEKRDIYRRIGVKEYIAWTLADKRIYWHRLQDGQYVPAETDAEGIVRSSVFPGLDLHAKALLQGDLSQVLATMQAGIASEVHAEFVKMLRGRS
jgi:Uma2 family endonuclease